MPPQANEEQHQQSKVKSQVVKTLIEKVLIDRDKRLQALSSQVVTGKPQPPEMTG